jgi:PKD repeat protein
LLEDLFQVEEEHRTMKRAVMKRYMGILILIVLLFLLLTGCGPTAPNMEPKAAFGFSAQNDFRYIPLLVSFDASASFDADGRITAYDWDFGDGSTGKGLSTEHTYVNPGDHIVTLRVVDNRGAQGTASLTVPVFGVPEDELLCRYSWRYNGQEQALETLIPEQLYEYYHSQDRQPLVGTYKYDDYVLDPLDDPTLSDISKALRAKIDGTDVDYAEFALSFVQGGISWEVDAPGFEYPLYPLETLVDKKGDCEDTTILFVSLLRVQDISSTIVAVDTDNDDMPDHVLALVPVDSNFKDQLNCRDGMSMGVYEIEGEFFAIAETAADADTSGYISLGCDPWGIDKSDFKDTWDL